MKSSQSREILIQSMENGELLSKQAKTEKLLTDVEKKFLLHAERGDTATVKRLLEEYKGQTDILDINCVDALNRSALIAAIENENIDLIRVLLEADIAVNDSLLHAIKEEFVEAVELLLEWEEKIHKPGQPYSWEAIEPSTATFTPDITPLILAAHMNNYEILKILLDRGATLPTPHDIRCGCDECISSSEIDSLRHSQARMNAYKALSGSSLIALSSKDPLLTAFELSWELRRLSFCEAEFRAEYQEMRQATQDFATALLDHARTSKELETMLNYNPDGAPWEPGERQTLERLKMAIKYKQKKFVAHPNVQQLLASIWYDGLPGFRRKSMVKQLFEVVKLGSLFPIYSIIYMIAPNSPKALFMKKPFVKFIFHSSSYVFFLMLLGMASQRVEFLLLEWFGNNWMKEVLADWKRRERGSLPGLVEGAVMIYVLGLIYNEVRALWTGGVSEYISDLWNIVDFITNCFYTIWISLRFTAVFIVTREAWSNLDPYTPREKWHTFDPMLLSEGAFAAGMIFSFLKLVHIFSLNPHLGPLQISLGRMIIDILKFFFIYTLVLFAFGCGMNQLMWYYADLEKAKCYVLPNPNVPDFDGNEKACSVWRRFANLFETSQSLFWASFGLVDLTSFDLAGIKSFTRFWALLLFGSYSVINIIVLLNMLIAMMSNSYQIISERSDIEWKFARSRLWISYFDEGDTLPAPFNLMPTTKTIFRTLFCKKKEGTGGSIKIKSKSKAEEDHDAVMRILLRRYVTAEQRKRDEYGITEDDVIEIRQDISSLRYELIDILKTNGMKTPDMVQDQTAVSKKGKIMERRLIKDFQIGIVEGILKEDFASSKNSSDVLKRIARVIKRRASSKKRNKKDWNAIVRSSTIDANPIGSTEERKEKQNARRYIIESNATTEGLDPEKLLQYNPKLSTVSPATRVAYAKFKISKIKQEFEEEKGEIERLDAGLKNSESGTEDPENKPSSNQNIIRPRPRPKSLLKKPEPEEKTYVINEKETGSDRKADPPKTTDAPSENAGSGEDSGKRNYPEPEAHVEEEHEKTTEIKSGVVEVDAKPVSEEEVVTDTGKADVATPSSQEVVAEAEAIKAELTSEEKVEEEEEVDSEKNKKPELLTRRFGRGMEEDSKHHVRFQMDRGFSRMNAMTMPPIPKSLSHEEKRYLLAVERGDMASVRKMLQLAHAKGAFNMNCVDPLGRGAVSLAIDGENLEMLELLLVMGIEAKDALLHAINVEFVEAVELLLEYEELIHKEGEPYSWEKVDWNIGTFSPDITPIILASHRNNYEIIKILLERGATLPSPHDIKCGCEECVRESQEDSLRFSLSRISQYRALASPSLIALSSNDPILTAFQLSWELRNLAFSEQESKSDYMELRRQCQKFAVDLLSQTRSSRELAIILNHDPESMPYEEGEHMKLARLELAIKMKQKTFVAHPNVQQLLAALWYEGLPGFRRKSLTKKLIDIITVAALFPFYCLMYIVAPGTKTGKLMRKPFMKFLIHASSYLFFLFILILVSQRTDKWIIEFLGSDSTRKALQQQKLIQRGNSPTALEWIVVAYVFGFIWEEIMEVYYGGLEEYVRDLWNVIDLTRNGLYILVIILRTVAYIQQTAKISEDASAAYIPREEWDDYDPQLISEGLFAAANIFSALKLVNIFSINPHLGPLQISVGRMVIDIIKFFFIYSLVLFAFACGLNQLLWYFAELERKKCYVLPNELPDWEGHPDACMRWRRFGNLFESSQSLFWASFGMIDLDNFELSGIKAYTRFWGLLMFGSYSVINIIVLLNLLIAMMSNSYAVIEEHSDTEWKFARTRLWMSYFEEGSTLPPPFNIIPTPKLVLKFLGLWTVDKLRRMSSKRKESQEKERDFRYTAVMRALVWRYVCQQHRQGEEAPVSEDHINEVKGEITTLKCDLLEVLLRNGFDTSSVATSDKEKTVLGRKMKIWERRLFKDFHLAPVTAEDKDQILRASSEKESPLSRFRRVARLVTLKSADRKWSDVVSGICQASQIGRSHTKEALKNQQNLQRAMAAAKKYIAHAEPDELTPEIIPGTPELIGNTIKDLLQEFQEVTKYLRTPKQSLSILKSTKTGEKKSNELILNVNTSPTNTVSSLDSKEVCKINNSSLPTISESLNTVKIQIIDELEEIESCQQYRKMEATPGKAENASRSAPAAASTEREMVSRSDRVNKIGRPVRKHLKTGWL